MRDLFDFSSEYMKDHILFDFDMVEIESPSSGIPATEKQSTVTDSSIFEVSFCYLQPGQQATLIISRYH